jgi:hypothetical protein
MLRGAVAGGAAVALVAAGAATGSQARAAAPAVTSPAAAPVLLVTGDRVQVRTAPNGKPDLRLVKAATSGPGATMNTIRLGGDSYVIPLSARPYVGRYLDPSLFDVTRLAKAGARTRLPVTLRYTGAAAPAVPGLTVTKASAGVATGYLTPSSARTFGTALARQAVVDAQAGWPANAGIFAGVTRISADVAPVVTPQFPMRTLIVHATGANGKPLKFGFGFVVNADDARKGGAFVQLVDGEARVSVPLGHYTALLSDDVFTPDGQVVSRLGLVNDYTVATQNQLLTIDTRTATAPNPTTSTPRPTRVQELDVDVNVFDALGQQSVGFTFATTPPQGRIFLTPVTTQPKFGRIGEVVKAYTVDPSVPGGRYAYDGVWEADGIPTTQHWVIPATGLSRVNSAWASDLPLRTVGTLRVLLPPSEFGAFTTFFRAPAPLRRADFVYAPAKTLIFESALMDYNASFDADPGFVDDFTPYGPGKTRSQTWFGTPYQHTPVDDVGACFLCRTGTEMVVVSNPHDATPAHQVEIFGSPDGTPVAHFTVFRNGTQVFTQDDAFGAVFPAPAAAADYRVVMDLSRFLQGANLSTTMTTELTFRSAGGQGPAGDPGDFCPIGDGTGCRVLPALTAHVDLGASLTGGVPVGTSTFRVTAGRIRGAAASAVTAVTVQVRRSGTTGAWTSLPVSGTGGSRTATFTAKAGQAGQVMDVLVTAKDAAGSTIRQTTERAFVVGG